MTSGRIARIFNWHPIRKQDLRATAWLDGLRGLAAFEVMIFHYADLWVDPDHGYGSDEQYYQLYRLPFIRTFWNSGRCMVCIFFIISGYVLSQSTLLKLRQRDFEGAFSSISSAVFRRGLRLLPPAIVSCVIGFILVRFGFRGSTENTYLPYFDSIWQQLWHFFIETLRFLNFFGWSPRSFGGDLMHKYEAVVWSIPMEIIGSMYIYIALVGTAYIESHLKFFMILGLALYALSLGCWSVFCFYLGILVADLDLSRQKRQDSYAKGHSNVVHSLLWSALLLQGFWMAGAPQRGPKERGDVALGFNMQWAMMPERVLNLDINYTGWSLAGLAMMVSMPKLKWAMSFLETNFCQYLGKISFAVYLNHVWIRDILGSRLQQSFIELLGNSMPALYIASLTWYVIMILCNFLVAGVFERSVDAPVVRFAKYVHEYCVSRARIQYDHGESFYLPTANRSAADSGDLSSETIQLESQQDDTQKK